MENDEYGKTMDAGNGCRNAIKSTKKNKLFIVPIINI